jgi:Ca2+-binding RTX toxin-like protein
VRPLLILFALAVLIAAPAHASTAGVQGTTLTFTAANGESNRVTISLSGETIRVTDTGATPTAGAGCTLSGRTVSCPRTGLTDIVADLGDRNDRLGISRAVALRSRVRGASGNDTLGGGGGPDELDGGGGADTVSYAGRNDAVTVTLGGGADDGAPGEADNLVSIERLVGTASADALTGGGAGERLDGFRGDDRVDGGGGNDTLIGGQGLDALSGADGNDVFASLSAEDGRDVFQGGAGVDRVDYAARRRGNGVVAQPDGRPRSGERPGGGLAFTDPLPSLVTLISGENDLIQTDVENLRGTSFADVLAAPLGGGRLEGLAGTDVLAGGPGGDDLQGGAGFDRILSRDVRNDAIACGSETDRVHADASDRPNADCESVLRSFAVALLAPPPPARTLRAENAIDVRVSCPAQAAVRCVGAVRMETVRRFRTGAGRLRPRSLGAARFNVPAGMAADVRVQAGAAGRSVVEQLGGATRVRLAARGRDDAGPARPAAARFVLRAG